MSAHTFSCVPKCTCTKNEPASHAMQTGRAPTHFFYKCVIPISNNNFYTFWERVSTAKCILNNAKIVFSILIKNVNFVEDFNNFCHQNTFSQSVKTRSHNARKRVLKKCKKPFSKIETSNKKIAFCYIIFALTMYMWEAGSFFVHFDFKLRTQKFLRFF